MRWTLFERMQSDTNAADVRAADVQGRPDRLPVATDLFGKGAQPVSIERRRVGLDRPAASSSRWKSRRLWPRSNPAYNIAGA